MPDSRRPRLIDVARHAGVSTATVSRCLNSPIQVSAETRLRIETAIDTLGYTPHFGGKALASNRSNTIGAVIPTMENAIFARGLQAVEEVIADRGVTLLVATSAYDPVREERQIRALLSRGVDGILLIGQSRPQTSYELIGRQPVPVILAWTFGGQDRPICVGFDNRGAARNMAEHVLDQGHLEIAMIAGITVWNDRATDRIEGVRKALANRGLVLRPERLVEAPYTIEEGEAAFLQLMAQAEPPTVVICGNDVLAAGALRAARSLSLRVPEDISITGFDDIDLADAVEPGLTTVHVPHRRMGRMAAKVLLGMRDRSVIEPPKKLNTWIIYRGSLGPPPKS